MSQRFNQSFNICLCDVNFEGQKWQLETIVFLKKKKTLVNQNRLEWDLYTSSFYLWCPRPRGVRVPVWPTAMSCAPLL